MVNKNTDNNSKLKRIRIQSTVSVACQDIWVTLYIKISSFACSTVSHAFTNASQRDLYAHNCRLPINTRDNRQLYTTPMYIGPCRWYKCMACKLETIFRLCGIYNFLTVHSTKSACSCWQNVWVMTFSIIIHRLNFQFLFMSDISDQSSKLMIIDAKAYDR